MACGTWSVEPEKPSVLWMSPALAKAPEQFPFQREGRTEWQNGYSLRDAEMQSHLVAQIGVCLMISFPFLCFAAISIHLRIRFLARMYSRARNVPFQQLNVVLFLYIPVRRNISRHGWSLWMWCIRLPCKFSAAAWQNLTNRTRNLHPHIHWSLGCDKVLDAEISQWQKHRSLERLGSLVSDSGGFRFALESSWDNLFRQI